MTGTMARGNLLLEKYEKDKRTGGGLLNDLKSAVENYTRAIDLGDLGGREAEAYGNRAATHNWLNDYDKAFADICRAVELEPSNGVYLFNRGIAYAEKEDWDNAFNDFFDAIKTYPPANNVGSELFKIKRTAKIIYKWRFKKTLEDEFYILLKDFTALYGKDIFGRETFRPLLLDFSIGEHRKDIKLLLGILEHNILKEFGESENPEAARKHAFQNIKDESERVVDILCCLLLYDVFFEE